jgi:hypothetical protein
MEKEFQKMHFEVFTLGQKYKFDGEEGEESFGDWRKRIFIFFF